MVFPLTNMKINSKLSNPFVNKLLILQTLIVVICGMGLTSCALFYDSTTNTQIKYSRPTIIDKDFDISGRFSIKSPQKNQYGNFTWRKMESFEELDFNTPLGQTVAKITLESGIATLTDEDDSYTGEDLDDMMEERLGFTLPLAYLHYWIQGLELPNLPVTKTLDNGFVQMGWTISYLDWQDKSHPKIIQIIKGDLSVKLLIEW